MATNALTKKWIKVEGIEELSRNLLKVKGINAQRVKGIVYPAAKLVRDKARTNAPVLTGRLRGAIFAGGGDQSKPDVLVGVRYRDSAAGKGAPHAHLVEYGHEGSRTVKSGAGGFGGLQLRYRVGPRPYLRPAISSSRPTVAKIIADGMKKAITEGLPK